MTTTPPEERSTHSCRPIRQTVLRVLGVVGNQRPKALSTAVGLALVALAAGLVLPTSATLSDQVAMGSVSVSAGSLAATTGLTLSDSGSAVRVAWTAPGSGMTPQGYHVYRRPTPGSYPGTPTGTSVTSPYLDASAAECTTWTYEVRAAHTNLEGPPTAEKSIRVDRTGPVVSSAHAYWTDSTPPVIDHLRTGVTGHAEVYANVTDACASASQLTVTFTFGAPFNATVPATYSATGWTPVAGGPTYNYRFQYTISPNPLHDGTTISWSVSAKDPSGNTSTTPGTSVVGDGTGPTFSRAVMVSALTNFYSTALGHGEVPSDGDARASGSFVYADASDPSGIASLTADISNVKSGATAVSLNGGNYTVDGDPTPWGWASTAQVLDTGMPDGNRTFTITATDGLGNPATTSPAQTVEVDDTPITPASSSCTNSGNGDNLLNDGDSTEFRLGDTIWPGSLKAGWDGSAITGGATLRNDTRDHFDLNADFGLSFLRSSLYTQSWNLAAASWVSGDVVFPAATFALTDRTTLRLDYGDPATSVTDRTKQSKANVGTSVRDAAGNLVATPYKVKCRTNPW